MNVEAMKVVDFWFTHNDKWYVKDPSFDKLITDNFKSMHDNALAGELDFWAETPEETLALIILLDQFTRNMYRDQAKMYAGDEKALELTKMAIANGYDDALADVKKSHFIYMPLMHSEDLLDQKLAVDLFTKNGLNGSADYAEQHRIIIERFGRFPHRNAILGRKSTAEEVEFLKQPGSSF